ncbi:MAG: glycosyltransferase family 4 protein [Deltaproteobacteria bacterium]|nr:glycosyltransferase family 4 protein [Deltaproteobacteria bacterium]
MNHKRSESKRITFISSFVPRQCGIATFTSDLITHTAKASSGKLSAEVIAMESADRLGYGDAVKLTIRRDQKKDYLAAADYINYRSDTFVCLQHEYGLFGGKAGSYICELLENITAPVVTTLHAVLEKPDASYRDTMILIADASIKLVVMSRHGVSMLREIYGVPADKIEMIPHGIPDLPFEDQASFKHRLGFTDRKIILTFGLLGRNKGIEWGIRALPEIVRRDPSILYLVLGVTHPEVKRNDGEEYRLFLQRLVLDLGLERHVRFINHFVTDEELHQFLNAADYYLTPYLHKEQLTSGTLAFAMGMGKAVISTPYWHAAELLADGRGILVPFQDHKAITATMISLLENPAACNTMRRRAFEFGRGMTWTKSGEAYWRLFGGLESPAALGVALDLEALPTKRMTVKELPELRLDHFLRLSDDIGILQHARYTIPDRFHGYCTDDNARALEVMVRCHHYHQDQESLRLMEIYFAFLLHARKPDGGFHNFMSYERRFLAPIQSDDATARVIGALGTLIAYSPRPLLADLARDVLLHAMTVADDFSLRGRAYEILGLADYIKGFPDDVHIRREMDKAADCLMQSYRQHATADWPWFENQLSYDNAALPSALFVASQTLQNKTYRKTAVDACRFLIEATFTGSHFSFVGCHGWYPNGGEKARFDQQPIEAASTVRLLREAFAATGDPSFIKLMRKAFYWFFGDNDSGVSLFDFRSRGCHDGLTPDGVNLNQGAESLISYMLAYLSIEEEQSTSTAVKAANG